MTARRKILLWAAGLLALAAAPAWAVSNGEGDLVLTFDGGIRPTTLPRHRPAPVQVWVSGSVRSTSGDPTRVPQVRRIEVAINRQGRLDDRGLPVCRPRQIRKAKEAKAKRACGAALVGRGRVAVQARLDNQAPSLVQARLLAFNGPSRNGRKLILAQAYSGKPPASFIFSFTVSRRRGTFGTVLSTTLAPTVRRWAYLTEFQMTLGRRYVYRGREHSFISAACNAPAGFDSPLYPFARATYALADGRSFEMSQANRCHVKSPVP
jgi:hypothetical protein